MNSKVQPHYSEDAKLEESTPQYPLDVEKK